MLNLSCDQTLLSLKKQNSLGENAETISGRGQRNWSQKHMVNLKLILLYYHQRVLDGAEVKHASAI